MSSVLHVNIRSDLIAIVDVCGDILGIPEGDPVKIVYKFVQDFCREICRQIFYEKISHQRCSNLPHLVLETWMLATGPAIYEKKWSLNLPQFMFQ